MHAISMDEFSTSLAISLVLVLSIAHVVEPGVIGRTTMSPHRKLSSILSDDDLSQQEALKFLEEYGYIDRVSSETEYREKITEPVMPSSTQSPEVSEVPVLKEGIENFQRRYHLPVTGEIDEATKAIMSKPRCGVPDYNQLSLVPSKNFLGGKTMELSKGTGDGQKGTGQDSSAVTPMDVTDMITQAVDTKDTSKHLSSQFLKGGPQRGKGKGGPNVPNGPPAPDMESLDGAEDQFSFFEVGSSSSADDFEDPDMEAEESVLLPTASPDENLQETTVLTYTVTDVFATILNDLDTTVPTTDYHVSDRTNGSDATRLREKRSLQEDAMATSRRERRNVNKGGSSSSSPGSGQAISAASLPITWRVVQEFASQHITDTSSIFTTAFRRWAEVTPLTFNERTSSDVLNIDISIYFVKSVDLPGVGGFTWSSGQLARSDMAAGKIYFNDDELWTDRSNQDYNLLTVAVHEIGHFLGLSHSSSSSSVMFPIYTSFTGEVSIDSESRTAVQNLYGKCDDAFDTVFDWVRYTSSNKRVYSTYFVRGSYNWRYNNLRDEVPYGDPKTLSSRFSGVPNNLDAVVQIMDNTRLDMYFFKGDKYWRFDHSNRRVYTTLEDGVQWSSGGRLISEGFPAKSGSNTRIPDNIDAAYYDVRDDNIYFFKGSQVYAYDVQADGCCVDGYPKSISEAYPGQYPYISALPDDIDAAYYSIKHKKVFFYKGSQYWENVTFNPSFTTVLNKVGLSSEWNTQWKDICNIE